MSASTVVGHHFHHEADVHRDSHSDEDDEHDPVASLNIWVKVCHVDFVGRLKVRFRTPATPAFEPPGLNASPQHDLGEHRREQDEQVQD
jgi:hypothetical protein